MQLLRAFLVHSYLCITSNGVFKQKNYVYTCLYKLCIRDARCDVYEVVFETEIRKQSAIKTAGKRKAPDVPKSDSTLLPSLARSLLKNTFYCQLTRYGAFPNTEALEEES